MGAVVDSAVAPYASSSSPPPPPAHGTVLPELPSAHRPGDMPPKNAVPDRLATWWKPVTSTPYPWLLGKNVVVDVSTVPSARSKRMSRSVAPSESCRELPTELPDVS